MAVKTTLKENCLKIVLEAGQTPDQKTAVEFLRREIAQLKNAGIVIAATLQSPPSLASLLNQVDQEFAVSLLAQCQKIAESDGVITVEEAEIINQINQKFISDKKTGSSC